MFNIMRYDFESLFADRGNRNGYIVREDVQAARWHTNQCPDPASVIVRDEEFRAVLSQINRLPRRIQEIIRRSYGFDGKRQSLAEIARYYRVSKQRIGQLRKMAVQALRQELSTAHGMSPPKTKHNK